ncbi:unnamed protein product [Cunninghamella echinulata]
MNSFSQLNLQIPNLWEVRDVINKVKNVVLNYTEMEAKVHEATNNEAWGASSTFMQEIAQGTFNYQYFNEIMPTVYKRFTEKEASQWRQIYKALVLLEYLVKNGSERVVDDARSHISMVKILRNFHYIDEKGKDQGINIRNRAKELADLLSSTEKIKAERKKAKQNRNKYTGVGSESVHGGLSSGGGFSSGGGSRFTGFGSDSLPTMGSGGGFSSSSGGFSSRGGFYDDDNTYGTGKYDDDQDDNGIEEEDHTRSKQSATSHSTSTTTKTQPTTAKEANLFDFGGDDNNNNNNNNNDDDWGDFTTGVGNNNNNTNSNSNAFDDFDDFQSAPTLTAATTTTIKTSQPTSVATNNNNNNNNNNTLLDLLGDDSFTSSASITTNTTTQPTALLNQTTTPIQASSATNNYNNNSITSSPSSTNNNNNNDNNNKNLPGGIWSQASSFVSLDSLGKTGQQNNKTSTGPSMNALKSSSVNAGWNSWANSANPSPTTPQQKSSTPKSPFDDLLS